MINLSIDDLQDILDKNISEELSKEISAYIKNEEMRTIRKEIYRKEYEERMFNIYDFGIEVCHKLQELYGNCFWISGYPHVKIKLKDVNRTILKVNKYLTKEENIEKIGYEIMICEKDNRYKTSFK